MSRVVIGVRVFRTGKLLIKFLLGVVSKEISAQKETKNPVKLFWGMVSFEDQGCRHELDAVLFHLLS